jgi:hypothetical protein
MTKGRLGKRITENYIKLLNNGGSINMRMWQKEIEVHCAQRCTLNLLGYENTSEAVMVYVQIVGIQNKVLVIRPRSSGGGYTIEVHTKKPKFNGVISVEMIYVDGLREVHKILDEMSSDDFSYFL